MISHPLALTLFNILLPPVALALWVLMYGIYLWREPAVRRWLDRQVYRVRQPRRGREVAISPPPMLFRRVPPPPPPRPPRPKIAIGAPPPSPPPVSVAEWRANKLPLRYRLLGRVRPAANDN